jgi:hypothetical protein
MSGRLHILAVSSLTKEVSVAIGQKELGAVEKKIFLAPLGNKFPIL